MENSHVLSFIALTCLKLLFLPMFISTDFEAHRKWMAITSQTSIKNWYHYEDKSNSTLNIPPFRAWLEYLLSCIAKYFDENMLIVENSNYQSTRAGFFMWLSVVLSDLIYFYGVNKIYKYIKRNAKPTGDIWQKKEIILAMLMLWNPGLILLDQIQFQHYGLLNGVLLISIANIFEKECIFAAFWFTVLINLDIAYLCMAPAYFMFLFFRHCFTTFKRVSDGKMTRENFSVDKCLKLCGIVVAVCFASFGPFIYLGQMWQVISQLFSIKRVSSHPFSTPNVWSFYIFFDWILSFIARCIKFIIYQDMGNSNTCSVKGLVKECELAILPDIAPWFTVALTVASLLPALQIIWKKPTTIAPLIQGIVLSTFGSFLFGYHVHQKAILSITLPFIITALLYTEEAKIFTFLSIIGHVSLLPGLFEETGTGIEAILLFFYTVYLVYSLTQMHRCSSPRLGMKTTLVEENDQRNLFWLFVLEFIYFGLKMIGMENKVPFLPAMLISNFCFVGVLGSWMHYCEIASVTKQHA